MYSNQVIARAVAYWNADVDRAWCQWPSRLWQRLLITQHSASSPAQDNKNDVSSVDSHNKTIRAVERVGSCCLSWMISVPIRYTRLFVIHWTFQAFIVLCILLNSLTLSLEMYPPEPSLVVALEYVNFFLTIIFVIEMCVKIYGLGLRVYLHDGFNVFDAVIVSVCIYVYIIYVCVCVVIAVVTFIHVCIDAQMQSLQ